MRRICFLLIILLPISSYAIIVPDENEIRRLCSLRIDKENFPDSKAIVLKSEKEITFTEDNRIRVEEFYILKFLNYSGMKAFENIKIGYNSGLWDLKILPSFTIKPDGTFDTLVESEMNFIKPDYIDEKASQYAKAKMMVLSFPALDESSSVFVHYVKETKGNSDYPFGWYFPFANEDPVLNFKLVVKYPSSRSITYKLYNTNKNPIKTSTELIVKFDTLEALPPEPNLPNFTDIRPSIAFTTMPSWGKVVQYVGSKFYPYIEAESELVREKFDELGGDINRLYLFVADSIGSIPIDIQDEILQPTPPDTVIRRGFGDPLQKIILLGSFLYRAGYAVYPLLLPIENMEPKLDIPIFEQYRSFALMAVKDNDTLFLDPISETSPMGVVPGYYGKSAAFVKKDGLDFIKVGGEEPSVYFNISLVLDDSGGVEGEYKVESKGSLSSRIRALFKGEKPRRIRMKCEEILSNFARKSRLKSYSVNGAENPLEPISVAISFAADSFAFFQKDMMLVNLPLPSGLEFELYPDVSLDERRLPMELGEILSIAASFNITPPPGYEIVFYPEKKELKNSCGEYHVFSEEMGENVRISYKLVRGCSRITPNQYGELITLYRGFEAPKNWIILLKRRS